MKSALQMVNETLKLDSDGMKMMIVHLMKEYAKNVATEIKEEIIDNASCWYGGGVDTEDMRNVKIEDYLL